MTAGAVLVAEVVIAAGTAIAKSESEQSLYDQQEENLHTFQMEQQAATNQKKIAADEQLRHVMGEQAAFMGQSGLTPASFQPVSIGDVEKFAQEEKAIDLNLQFKENAIDSKIGEISAKASWAPVINMFSAAESVWNSSAVQSGLGGAKGSTVKAPSGKVSSKNPVKITTMPRLSGHINNFNRNLLEEE